MKISSNKVSSVISFFREELAGIYPTEEIEQFVFLAFNEFLGFKRVDLTMKANETMSESDLLKFNFAVKELKKHKPIQYILGSTEFYGIKLKVNEHVLIPRPETEELVEFILSELQVSNSQLNVLDIGTGSGCIAIALKKKIPSAKVYALDVSEEALLVAKENARINNVEINFICQDIFAPSITHSFDGIVSNPPYIRISEKDKMSKNVLNYEPHLALFVNDNDPLLFYRKITDFSLNHLNPHGKLYFEINEAFGGNVKYLMEKKYFKNVIVKKDLCGKDRMVRGEK